MLSGHKEAITSISIHPSGKLALSVSKDNTLKLWNLVQGKRKHELFSDESYPDSAKSDDLQKLS